MKVIRREGLHKTVGILRRKEQQKRAQDHLDKEVLREPVFRVNKLTKEPYYYGVSM